MSPNWDGLTDNHMANIYRQYAYPYSSYLWMDPGAEVIIDHLVNVITDILTRYLQLKNFLDKASVDPRPLQEYEVWANVKPMSKFTLTQR